MADALAHTADSNTRAFGMNFGQSVGGDSFALIPNFERQETVSEGDTNCCRLAFGMAMNVGKAFLHDAEQAQLKVPIETLQIRRYVEIDLDAASLSEPVDIFGQCRP